jgi:Flp pilus assembly protein TadB
VFIQGRRPTRGTAAISARFPDAATIEECSMKILFWVGIAMVVAWAILWLGIKMAIGAVHLLLVLGLIAIVWGLIQARRT